MNTKYHNKKVKNQSDDYFRDYLKDLFNDDEEIFVEDASKSMPIEAFFSSNTQVKESQLDKIVNNTKSIVTTIKLPNSSEPGSILSQVESMIALLDSLYLLRKPLSPKVRQCLLSLAEQLIDDYEVSQWTKQLPKAGVLSEV